MLRRIHHSRTATALYRAMPCIKRFIDRVYMVYMGSGEMMINRFYWYVFRTLRYTLPGWLPPSRQRQSKLSLPLDDNKPTLIEAARIIGILRPPLPSGNFPVTAGNWDKQFQKLADNTSFQSLSSRISTGSMIPSDADIAGNIKVAINRHGQYLLEDGAPVLAAALARGDQKVRVLVTRRHYHWARFRREVYLYSQEQPSGAYQTTVHPDLQNIPAHRREDRWEMIKANLPITTGTVLDIGANWGYFCHRLEDLGYKCTAAENNYRWQYFLKKLRDFEGKRFPIYGHSIFDIEKRNFDIVLALSIFHHFLRSESLYNKMIKLLGELQMQAMFFEPHQTGHGFKNAYADFTEEKFVQFVIDHSCLKRYRLLGRTARGRNLYLLSID